MANIRNVQESRPLDRVVHGFVNRALSFEQRYWWRSQWNAMEPSQLLDTFLLMPGIARLCTSPVRPC